MAAASLDCLFSPLIIPRWSPSLWKFRLLDCHLTFRYDIYIYPWLEGRAGATQIRSRSQSGTRAAVVLLAVWAQQLQKMFSLSVSDWLIKVRIGANQKVLMKIFAEAIDPLLSGNYTEEHMEEDGLCSGPMWLSETGVTSGESEQWENRERGDMNHFRSTSGFWGRFFLMEITAQTLCGGLKGWFAKLLQLVMNTLNQALYTVGKAVVLFLQFKRYYAVRMESSTL